MDSNIILAERIARAYPLESEKARTGRQLRLFIQEFLSSHSIVISDPERQQDLEYRVRAALQLRLLRLRQDLQN